MMMMMNQSNGILKEFWVCVMNQANGPHVVFRETTCWMKLEIVGRIWTPKKPSSLDTRIQGKNESHKTFTPNLD
jgi:hypothetical protein